MRRKATAKNFSFRRAQGNANISLKSRENIPFRLISGRPSKSPAGKGLGKAGAKRLGRLLKRAIQHKESAGERNDSLPKTPVRLLKYQIQTEAENAPKTNTVPLASHHVSQLILSVVSQCKHRGGMSMAELKQTLAAGGYNVTKNNRQVNVVTKRLVNNETLVRTTRNASFIRLNNKKLADTARLTHEMNSPKPKEDVKQSITSSNPPKETGESQTQATKTTRAAGKSRKPNSKTRKPAAKSQKTKGKTHKPAAKSQKLKGKTRKPAAKSQKPKGKTRKSAAKSQKPKGKTRKPAAKSYRPRRKTPKVRRKSSKRRSVKSRVVWLRKSQRKTQRARRRRPKQNLYPYKSSWRRQQPKRRLLKMRLRSRTRQRRVARRSVYY
ncbi:histone H1.1-like isoform X2 [Thunnus maccoyii]|uniref:histone H1.1-like isoform X2 n=1 Tax=Thunnus maccoyii TaxID=8240 RepID=UPI001C4B47BA|nr:histone H1.1-like isoform X2 [Thunnus maccoyii]